MTKDVIDSEGKIEKKIRIKSKMTVTWKTKQAEWTNGYVIKNSQK